MLFLPPGRPYLSQVPVVLVFLYTEYGHTEYSKIHGEIFSEFFYLLCQCCLFFLWTFFIMTHRVPLFSRHLLGHLCSNAALIPFSLFITEWSYFPSPAGKWFLSGKRVIWGEGSFSETGCFLQTWLFVWFVTSNLHCFFEPNTIEEGFCRWLCYSLSHLSQLPLFTRDPLAVGGASWWHFLSFGNSLWVCFFYFTSFHVASAQF